jgi:hypothetical protein
MLPRAADMLAVAVHTPAVVLGDDRSGTAAWAPMPGEAEPEPAASAGTASTNSAQVNEPIDFVLTTPPIGSMNDGDTRRQTLRAAYQTLKST